MIELTDEQEATIDRWLSAVETGKPDGDYTNVTRLYDGPGGRRQITYGKHQTTEAGRNVQKMVKNYLAREGTTLTDRGREVLTKFASAPTYSMVGDEGLRRILIRAGSDPVMEDIQNEFFLTHYMKPARKWADDNGFSEALSMLVIYDSFIQSGGIPSWLRRRFREVPPAKGGSERAWISRYVDTRHQWLKYWGDGKSPKSRALRNSSYRTTSLNTLTDSNNWGLHDWPIKVNGISVRRANANRSNPVKWPCDKCGGSGVIANVV